MQAPRIFCAIDTPDLDAARQLAQTLGGLKLGLKLGLEFFTAQGAAGVDAVRMAAGAETEIFLDLKLHDIPNTVAGAVQAAMRVEADFITLHASGGAEMMRRAVEAAQEAHARTGVRLPRLLGVTVLTALGEDDVRAVGQMTPVEEQVQRLAMLAKGAGLAGVVCSPLEIASLRARLPAPFVLVVPGIRQAQSAQGDQKRVMTPAQAAAAGADYLVIGRPITQAQDPRAAACAIVEILKEQD